MRVENNDEGKAKVANIDEDKIDCWRKNQQS